MGWNFFRPERNESFDILPASQRVSETNWYLGTADAVYQNIDIIEPHRARFIVLLAGDHVYKMDYELMLQQHVEQRADVTVGCLEMPRSESSGFGIMQVDDDDVVQSFLEKPADPPPMPGKPDVSLASMGIYVFDTKFLFDQLKRDAEDPNSTHDFGKDIIPPAKFVHDEESRRGYAVSSLVSGGCIISGASLRRSLLFTGVRINSYASVENAVIMPYVNVGRGAQLKNVVIDRGIEIPEGLVVGDDPE